jgi:PAS domain S-box-containing protein
MNADSPKDKISILKPEQKNSGNGNKSVSSSKNGNSARGLADFVESFLSGSRLRRAGLPTKAKAPEPIAQEEPELLDLMLEGPDALVIVERESGLIVEANHRFSEWTGVARETLTDRKLLDFFPESEHKAARTLFEDAGAGGVHVIELPHINRGSRPHLIEFTASPTKTANGAFAVIVGRDVGERAATERYLRGERDRLNLFLRAMRDTLVLLSPGGDILFANPAAEQVFEPYELPVICHRWLCEFARNDHNDLQGLASAYEGQTLEIPATDGRIFLVTRSFLFESGRKAMIMLMAKDVTEQRLIENQNHQLEIELIRESKLAEFGTLSAGIAHNLNGPLTGILGFCDLMEIRQPGQMEVQQIRQQAVVMKEIVSNMLHKSRSERESQPKELVVEDVIRTELRFLEANLFFKHQVKRVVDLDANVPPIYGVYIDFSQVIGNLLRNAIDAMYNSQERVLTVKTKLDNGYLLMQISDTGCGMSEETRNSLFQPFFTTKPKAQDAKPGEPTGTGLGLHTSRSILARYGAEVTVDSELGKGSTFSIRLPLHRRPVM